MIENLLGLAHISFPCNVIAVVENSCLNFYHEILCWILMRNPDDHLGWVATLAATRPDMGDVHQKWGGRAGAQPRHRRRHHRDGNHCESDVDDDQMKSEIPLLWVDSAAEWGNRRKRILDEKEDDHQSAAEKRPFWEQIILIQTNLPHLLLVGLFNQSGGVSHPQRSLKWNWDCDGDGVKFEGLHLHQFDKLMTYYYTSLLLPLTSVKEAKCTYMCELPLNEELLCRPMLKSSLIY